MPMTNTMTAIFVLKDRCFITARPPVRNTGSTPLIQNTCQEHCPVSFDVVHHMKLIHRYLWEGYLEEADHLRHTPQNKEIYAKRKETIERVFADAKEKHGMNLKKMASWAWKTPRLACTNICNNAKKPQIEDLKSGFVDGQKEQ
jgi:hypothetical protein